MSTLFDDLFVRRTEDAERRARFAALPLPTHRLVIYFTPRSGSSWLTDIIRQARRLGSGNEIFNPNFVAGIANGIQALSKADYLTQVQRRFGSKNGRFSFEITAHQLDRLFPDPSEFMDVFNTESCTSAWLIRKDIVAQAVSLAKMVETQVSHTPHASIEERVETDRIFKYDHFKIKRWLVHIRNAELRSEELFEQFGITPFRMCYEDMMLAGPEIVRARIAALLKVPNRNFPELAPQHEKLGTARNEEFALRFHEEAGDFLRELEAERAPMLEQIEPLSLNEGHNPLR